MQFCKKTLQTSALLICFNISTDLLASDDAEKTPPGKTAIVLGNIHEDWFAGHKQQAESDLGKELSALGKELSAYAQKEHAKSFQLDEFRRSFIASGFAEIFGV